MSTWLQKASGKKEEEEEQTTGTSGWLAAQQKRAKEKAAANAARAAASVPTKAEAPAAPQPSEEPGRHRPNANQWTRDEAAAAAAEVQANDEAAAEERFGGMTTDELLSYVPTDGRDRNLYNTFMRGRLSAAESLNRQSRQAMSDAASAGYDAEAYREFLGMPGASDEEIFGLAQAIRANNAQARSLEPQKWLEYAEGLKESQARKDSLTEKGRELGSRAAAANEQGQVWEYSNVIKSYGELINSPDFAKKSQYNPAENSLTYKAINGDREAQDSILSLNSRNTGFTDVSRDSLLGYNGGKGDYLFNLTDTEKSIYNALYASSPEAASDFVEKLKPYLEVRARDSAQTWASFMAQRFPVLTSIATIPAGAEQSREYLAQIGDLIRDGKINQNSADYRASQMSNTVRGEVAKMAEAKWGEVGSAAYNLGMSMGDFLFSTAAGGGTKALSLGLMGTRAAANTVLNLKDRGLDDTAAFTLGSIAGAAEIITESFSLEKLLNPNLVADGIAKNILKNFLAEASEEGASDLINWAAEYIYDAITGNNEAEWKQKVYDAIQNGADPNDAVLAAIQDNLVQLGTDMLSGGISGGIMSAAGTPFYLNNFNASQQGQYANAIRGNEEDLQALIQRGLESPQNTESYQLAQAALKQFADGKTPSTLTIARLVEANQQQAENEAAEQSGQGRFRLTLPRTAETQNAPQATPAETAHPADTMLDTNGAETNTAQEPPPVPQETSSTPGLTLPARTTETAEGAAETPRLTLPARTTETEDGTAEAPRLTLPTQDTQAATEAPPTPSAEQVSAFDEQAESELVERLTKMKPGLMVDDYAMSKLSVSQIGAIDETAKRLGLRVGFIDLGALKDSNAKIYDNGVVLIEKGNTNPIGYLYGHEMSHWLQQNSPEAYNEFAKAARATDPEWFKHREEEYNTELRKSGKEMSPEEIQDEILCDYAGWLVKDEDVLNRFINQNKDKPNVLRRLYEAIKALAAKLTGRERQQANTAADLLLRAMNATEANVQNGIMSTGGTRSSFGGILAEYADMEAQERAEDLHTRGNRTRERGPAFNNYVRKKTGWFKGGDGMWRFEIDDHGSRVTVGEPLKHLNDSGYETLSDLLYDYDPSVWTTSEDEINDLRDRYIYDLGYPEPDDVAQKFASGHGTIGDVLEHKELYRQYPFIATVPLEFEKLDPTTLGRTTDSGITLNTSLLSNETELRSTLLHEIQHLIQREEGFARGSNTRYWQSQIDNGMDTTRPSEVNALKEYNRIKAENPDIVRDAIKLDEMFYKTHNDYEVLVDSNGVVHDNEWVNREPGEIVPEDEAWGEYKKFKSEMEDKYGKTLDEYYDALATLGASPEEAEVTAIIGPTPRSADEMYRDTYGEGEARNVELRARLNPEVARDMPPFTGDEDSVFVEPELRTKSSTKGLDADAAPESIREISDEEIDKAVAESITGEDLDADIDRILQDPSVSPALKDIMRRLQGEQTSEPAEEPKQPAQRASNEEYVAALEDGDIAKAQQLVRETADAAMPDSKVRSASTGELRYVYHYTNKNFYEFKPMGQSAGSNRTLGDGYYVSTSETEFKSFGKNKMTLFANITNPFEMDLTEEQAQAVYDKYFRPHREDRFHTYEPHVVGKLQSYSQVFDYLKEAAEKNGTTTSAILSELGFDGVHSGPEWVAFYPEQLKSADVATYNDDGQLIPLSERFNQENPDIRYSLKGINAGTAPASVQKSGQMPARKNDRVERMKFKYERAIEEQKGKTFQANAQRNSDLARQKREFREQMAAQRERENERRERTTFKHEQEVEEVKGKLFQERARRYSELAKQKREFQEKEAKGKEERRARELREKIAAHTKSLLAEYKRPTDKHHVPEGLRGAVNAVLSSINMSSGYSLAEDGDGGQLHVPVGEGVAETKRTQAFAQLRSELEKERERLVLDWSMIDDPDGALNKLVGEWADTPIANMDSEQLQAVYDVLRNIEHAIKTADKMLSASKEARVSGFANAIREENVGKKKPLELNGKLGDALKHVRLDILTPEAYFHRLGKSGEAVFKMLREGQDSYIRSIEDAVNATSDILKGTDVRKLETDKHTVTLGGTEVTMSTAQLMELYCLMQRDQGMQHISTGGVVVEPSRKGLKKNTQTDPLHPSEQELNDAIDLLTPEQIRIAEAMQEYLTKDMSDLGNEATMQVYGYKKFGDEDNYWKIRSNKNELQSTVEKDTQTTSVANKGFTKATKPNANTSVLIGSAFDTFSQSVSDMATYSAWLAISEDLNRIRNYTFWDENGNRITTIQTILDRVHGEGGANYFKQLMADIANGTQNDAGLTEGFVGAYKAAAIGANIRVIVQQPTAILRALEMIDPKYFANIKDPFKAFERAKEYAPIAQWKDWGYFDINTGRKMKDVLMESAETPLEKARQASMSLAGKADSWAWGILWNAVEKETAKTTNLTPGSEEFYQHCAERFSDIIDHTQVVDGIIQRAPIQRSSNSINKMASSFMSEPLKQYAQFMSAVYDVKNGKDGADKHLVRTTVAMAAAGLLNNAVQSLIDALRDDDKEKKYWEKFLEKSFGYNSDDDTIRKKIKTFLGSNMGELVNPAEYIPYAKDIMSIYKGYGVERMDMSLVAELVNAVNRLQNTLAGDSKYTVANSVAYVTERLAKLTGIPAANIDRDIKAILNTVANEADIPLLQYYLNRYQFKHAKSGNLSKDLVNILWNAKQKGDDDYQAVYDRLVADGYEEDVIETGMLSKLSETTGLTQAIKDADAANNANESYDTMEILSAFRSLNLPQDEEEALLEWKLTDGQWEKYATLKDADIGHDIRFDIMQKYSELNANKEIDRALEFEYYVDGLGLTSEQAQLVKDTYKFWTQVPAEAKRYETTKLAGLSNDKAMHVAEVLGAIKPLPGKEDVTDIQRYRAIESDKTLTNAEKIKVIGSIMGPELKTEKGNPTQWAKFNTALNNGQTLSQAIDLCENGRLDEFAKWTESAAKGQKVTWDVYDTFLKETAKLDGKENGVSVNGLLKKRVVAYIDSLNLTPEQKDALLTDYNSTYKHDVTWHNGSYGSSSGSGRTYARANLSRLELPRTNTRQTGRLTLPTR